MGLYPTGSRGARRLRERERRRASHGPRGGGLGQTLVPSFPSEGRPSSIFKRIPLGALPQSGVTLWTRVHRNARDPLWYIRFLFLKLVVSRSFPAPDLNTIERSNVLEHGSCGVPEDSPRSSKVCSTHVGRPRSLLDVNLQRAVGRRRGLHRGHVEHAPLLSAAREARDRERFGKRGSDARATRPKD